ncbi:MAG: hypothetical protein HY905_24400 [Deltaproteobacteria bacterium]|nr:hypothetical protein [Deltaproteobacteria bacterium]
MGVAAGLHACAGGDQLACDPATCAADCRTARWSGGECRDNACRCLSSSPDADADVAPDDVRVPPDAGDVHPESPDRGPDDVRDVDVDVPDMRDVDVRPEVICELPPDRPEARDDIPGGDGCCGPETYEAKSGCDPLLCFLSCGGTCSTGGECECAPPP